MQSCLDDELTCVCEDKAICGPGILSSSGTTGVQTVRRTGGPWAEGAIQAPNY